MIIAFLVVLYHASPQKRLKEEISLKTTPNNTGIGSVFLNWSFYSPEEMIYKVYRSKGESENFEMIARDHTQITSVSCLHVYPHEDAKDQLTGWMRAYGKEIIHVTPISFEAFNLDPLSHLKNEAKNEWKYDVVLLGTWDNNNNKDLSDNAVQPLKDFIHSGRGVIFGHDTFLILPNTSSLPSHLNINLFASYLDITVHEYAYFSRVSEVFIAKTGLLTSYPWDLETGINFTIPATHNSNQELNNLNNVNFYLKSVEVDTKPQFSYYLTTKNNVAFIQTGHMNGEATPDEQKIVANLIFASNQLMKDKTMTDYSAIDEAPPKAPRIYGTYKNFAFLSEDQGTTYTYYVLSFHATNTSVGSHIASSNNITCTVTTGIKGYYYLFDHHKSTQLSSNNWNFTTDNQLNDIIHGRGYLHVYCVDNANNTSPVTTVWVQSLENTCDYQSSKRHLRFLLSSMSLILGHRKTVTKI